MDRTSRGNLYHPLHCHAPGRPKLVSSHQAQVGTYLGHLVCPEDSSFHSLVFHDATMKGLPDAHLGTLIFGDTNKMGNNNIFSLHLPSYLFQLTDAWHFRDDSTRDAFPATPLAKRGLV